MVKRKAVLRQPESNRESRLLPTVQPLRRPPATGRAVELAFLRWEKRDLAPTERFWRDFGFHIVSSTPQRLVARAADSAPCIAIAERGPANRFVGPAFRMSDDTDLESCAKRFGGTWLRPDRIPGGGRGVSLQDPSGRDVWLLQGQARVAPLPLREPVNPLSNTVRHAPRINRTVRTPIEPAQVA